MEERINIEQKNYERTEAKIPKKKSKIGLILALFTLFLVIFMLIGFAFLNSQSRNQAPVRVVSLQQQNAVERAQDRLVEVRTNIISEGPEYNEQAGNEINSIRNDLRIAFENSGDVARGTWLEVDRQLEGVEQSIQSQGGNILDTIDNVIQSLRQDIFYRS